MSVDICGLFMSTENDERQQLGATSGRLRDDGQRDGNLL